MYHTAVIAVKTQGSTSLQPVVYCTALSVLRPANTFLMSYRMYVRETAPALMSCSVRSCLLLHSLCIAKGQPRCHYRLRRGWRSQTSRALAPYAGGRSFWGTDGETSPALTGGGGGHPTPADYGFGGERLNGVLLPLKRYVYAILTLVGGTHVTALSSLQTTRLSERGRGWCFAKQCFFIDYT